MGRSNTTPKILVVDDKPANLGVLFKQLEQAGYKVLLAQNGQRALQQTEKDRPDLILLDIMMPGIDGIEVCRRLKQKPTTKEIPVIFMTALTNVESKVAGFAAGAVDYVTKPLETQEVLARVNTHLTLRRLQENLAARNEELDAFAHTVAHDLRNPLAMVTTYGDLIREEGGLSVTQQEYLAALLRNAQRMDNIIDEIQLLAGVRQATIVAQPLDMNHIIHEVKQRLAHMIAEYQARIILPEEWPVAVGHAPWIEEVWANYLSNGLKYGGRPPRLELGACIQANGVVKFQITDNGPGLTAEQQAQLFRPFVRLDQTRVDGYGLGLSIVRRIVERLGGEVAVTSEPGCGSTFSFTLPAYDGASTVG